MPVILHTCKDYTKLFVLEKLINKIFFYFKKRVIRIIAIMFVIDKQQLVYLGNHVRPSTIKD